MADELSYLINAFLHQDFDLEFGTLQGGIEAYLERSLNEDVMRLHADATARLLASPTEQALRDYFREIAADWDPTYRTMPPHTHMEFVQDVLARAEAELRRRMGGNLPSDHLRNPGWLAGAKAVAQEAGISDLVVDPKQPISLSAIYNGRRFHYREARGFELRHDGPEGELVAGVSGPIDRVLRLIAALLTGVEAKGWSSTEQ